MKKIPILVLHGWNLSAERFDLLVEELRKRKYIVFCFDLPGFGKEPVPNKPFYLSDYVDFVEKKLVDLHVEKINIIGHSFGGRIGIKMAAQNPNIVEKLILTGAPGINPVPKAKVLFFLFLAKVGNAFFSLPVISLLKDKARQLLYRGAKATDFYNTDKRMRETFKNIINEDLVPYLKEINLPILLVWGKEDLIVPVKVAQEMFKFLKNAKLSIIPQARHGVPWTHPKAFADEVEKFI